MQLVYEGEVDLYKEVTSGYDIVGGGSSLPTTVKREYASFYIKKKEEQEVFAISEESGFNKDFKKVAINYFSDCDKVLKKIKENIYTKKNIQDIVFEFNYKCN